MVNRSTKITLSNNTPFPVTMLAKGEMDGDGEASHLCHGKWSDDMEPPSTIQPGTNGGGIVSWQSQNKGPITGTEGWVKYLMTPHNLVNTAEKCKTYLLYIYWDNPFIWDNETRNRVFDFKMSTSDMIILKTFYLDINTSEVLAEPNPDTVPFTAVVTNDVKSCDLDGQAFWTGATGSDNSHDCSVEAFVVNRTQSGSAVLGVTWWDVIAVRNTWLV